MRITLIETLITIFGFILILFSILIIFLGKKVGGDSKQTQMIKIGEMIEVSTNSVLMLVLIFTMLTISPLLLAYWKPDLKNYVHKDTLENNYLAMEELSLDINGQVLDEDHNFAEEVSVSLERQVDDYRETLKTNTDSQGTFYFTLDHVRPKEKYILTWAKPGYARKMQVFGFGRVNYAIILNREEDF